MKLRYSYYDKESHTNVITGWIDCEKFTVNQAKQCAKDLDKISDSWTIEYKRG